MLKFFLIVTPTSKLRFVISISKYEGKLLKIGSLFYGSVFLKLTVFLVCFNPIFPRITHLFIAYPLYKSVTY